MAGGVLRVVEHYWRWYRRNWRATAVSSLLQPLLFLLAFGVGFGALVAGTDRAAAVTGGVPYLQWLAPGLLAMSAVQTAAFESSYPVLSGFKWQRTFVAMVATPVTPAQAGLGHLTWTVLRMLSAGVVYALVITAFGGVASPWFAVSVLAATLSGTAFAALVMAFATRVQQPGAPFSALFRFVLIPMTLISGTFFPVDALPVAVRPLAWVTPLWHGTELARGAALERIELWPALGHVGYLLALLGLGGWLVCRGFRSRLAA